VIICSLFVITNLQCKAFTEDCVHFRTKHIMFHWMYINLKLLPIVSKTWGQSKNQAYLLIHWVVTHTQINLDLWNTALGHGFYFQYRNSRTFPVESLCMIVNAPWYVPNTVIRRDLKIPTVKEEIRRYSSQYSVRLSTHPNDLIVNFIELPDNRRLRRHLPNDLPTRFLPSVIVVFVITVF
jgi:hypothetical protein